MVCANVVEDLGDLVQEILHYFSTWTRLKKAVAWMLKIKNILLMLCRKRKELSAAKTPDEVNKKMKNFKINLLKADSNKLTVENLMAAEQAIICHCQERTFAIDITALKRCGSVKRNSCLCKLNPVLEDGILRVGGRLNRAALPEESKRPAILDKNLHVTMLIFRETNDNLGYSGRNHVLVKVRSNYWIPRANTATRTIMSKCIICRHTCGAAGQQQMENLPRDGVIPDDPPFTNTGVDYFGPFEVKRG